MKKTVSALLAVMAFSVMSGKANATMTITEYLEKVDSPDKVVQDQLLSYLVGLGDAFGVANGALSLRNEPLLYCGLGDSNAYTLKGLLDGEAAKYRQGRNTYPIEALALKMLQKTYPCKTK